MVLVEFLSPGCAECVGFSDDFDSMAKEIYTQKENKLEVVAIDLRRNR